MDWIIDLLKGSVQAAASSPETPVFVMILVILIAIILTIGNETKK